MRRYAEAAAAYEAAGDLDAVVRLALDQLGAPQRAYAIVRKTRSAESARHLAEYCMQSKDFAGAVEFLLLSGQMDQAFDIAQVRSDKRGSCDACTPRLACLADLYLVCQADMYLRACMPCLTCLRPCSVHQFLCMCASCASLLDIHNTKLAASHVISHSIPFICTLARCPDAQAAIHCAPPALTH